LPGVDACSYPDYKVGKRAADHSAADVLSGTTVPFGTAFFRKIQFTIAGRRGLHRRPSIEQANGQSGCGNDRSGKESMANTTSAKKATRKIARRTIVNKARRTKMRGSVRNVEEAIQKGDRDAAIKALRAAEPELMKAAQQNIIHKNNASRKVSRLTYQIAKLAK